MRRAGSRSRTLARHLGHAWDEVLLEDGESSGELGRHPWDARYPIVLDTTAATGLGYLPVGDYAATVVAEVDWLASALRGGSLRLDEEFFANSFDYAVEDAYLAERRG